MPGAGLTGTPGGPAPSDRPALEPYWGKPAVRNLRGDDGNVGIIRSPVRAIVLPDHAGRVLSREIEFKSQAPRLFPELKAIPDVARRRGTSGPGAVARRDPEHAWKHHAREPGGPATARGDGAAGRGGKSEDPSHRRTEQGV